MLALEGIKVLDFCRNAPGMFATMILADLGADVLMIERPMDETRAAYERIVAGIAGPEDERRHASFNALQRNKRSIALNLKEPEALEVFRRLAAEADVVVEGFRPGVVDRLGVGYSQVKQINPRAVYCSVSGYGQTGPYSQMAGHDINYISFAGALGLIGIPLTANRPSRSTSSQTTLAAGCAARSASLPPSWPVRRPDRANTWTSP